MRKSCVTTSKGSLQPLFFKISIDQISRVEESEIKTRTLGVVFQNLCVVGLGASATYKSTLGSALDFTKIFKLIRQLRQPPTREIITRFEGVVSPGEMLRESLNYSPWHVL
jgi:ATP-binding cassette subfamily G (WHITE) protein 2 (SNQ2)